MPKTMDMLREEHRNMSRLLGLLERQVDLFERAGEPDYELIGQIVDYFRSFPELYHHPKEELILKAMAKRDPDRAAGFAALQQEHGEVANRLSRFTRAVVGVLLDEEVPREAFVIAARAFIADERKHMAGEEQHFLPAALAVLTEDDWQGIDRRVARFRDPLSERAAALRYDLVQRALEDWRNGQSGT